MEADQFEEAVGSFQRTLQLSPQFSKVYQLLATSLQKLNRQQQAIEVLQQGYAVADERGDQMPRDEMGKMLVQLGQSLPASKRTADTKGDGFRCQRPGCMLGRRAHQLAKPPMNDEQGRRIYDTICADCWSDWLRNYSIKVINELRLDLSTERGQEEYDRYMREFLGLE
jgi:Fe-S cluster biosynthesis and repair protein YggX